MVFRASGPWTNSLHDTRGSAGGVPCLGLWLRCSLLGSGRLHCGVYATTAPHLHPALVSALVGLILATVVSTVTCLAAVFTACVRSIKGWSCFSLISILQVLAGVASIAGTAAFPLSWDSPRVQNMCGDDASLYHPAACVVGWATYAALCGGVLLLVCSCLAFRAAAATKSHPVIDQLHKGHNIVLLI
ncbi:hypothetical protein Pmani_013816 [Petrolisthes manimaculis]|uniref:Uncharacterized protein n=1 Tax=Petrolisthes manimaculis TaxID=1843537 RepID=A0AAE1PVC9_9EUCA|nr:hypothetical protein Pmani_013816 [Petrolisthes manimaculis]